MKLKTEIHIRGFVKKKKKKKPTLKTSQIRAHSPIATGPGHTFPSFSA